MADSDEANAKSIDASVGGLVWVRRRNGSWWPGRILGLDELSESCLVSPRSGTPVKLLGRDDASIDWYNLEKSKRVKAFRCGEYNECIEKAKASAANAGKKAVKYARREDAILHALELESAHLGKNCSEFSYRRDTSGGEHNISARESSSLSDSIEEDGDMADDISDAENSSDLVPALFRSVTSLEESNNADSYKVQPEQGRRRTPNDSEDDGTEGVKRMRGLEDLGIGVVSNGKVESKKLLELVEEDSTLPGDSYVGHCISNGKPSNCSKVYSSSYKRKRSQVPSVHEFLKKRNRRRPLTKVMESTAMVSVPVICDELPNSCGSPIWGLSDGKSSELEMCAVINNNSESNGACCENGASLNVADAFKVKDNETSNISGLADNEATDKLFDVPLVGDVKQSIGSPSSGKSAMATRKQTSKISQAVESLRTEGRNESGPTSSEAAHGNIINQKIKKDASKWQSKRKRNSRRTRKGRKQVSTTYMDMDNGSNAHLTGTEHSNGFSKESDHKTDTNGTVELLPRRHSRFTVRSRYQIPSYNRNNVSDTPLYEVTIEVKASYRPQHVPLVSLMSKLNGKAIVGHPLTVEVLDEGHCDVLLSRTELDLGGDENGSSIKPGSGKGRIRSKQLIFPPGFTMRRSPKQKKAGQLSKKIRKLSSLTGQKRSEDDSKPVVERSEDDSKPVVEKSEDDSKPVVEKPEGRVISCIPLKVVFSRMNEAVNGLARPANRALNP